MPHPIQRQGKATAFHLPYEFSRSPLPARTTRADFNVYPPSNKKEGEFLVHVKDFFYEVGSVAERGESFLEYWSDTNLPYGLEDFIRDIITALPRNHSDWPAARRALAEKGVEWLKNHPEPVVETITSLPEQGPLLISLNGQHQLVDQIYLEKGSRLDEASKRSAYIPVDFHHTNDGAPTTATTESGQTVYYAHTDNEAMKIARTMAGEDIGDTTLPSLPPISDNTFPFPLRRGALTMITPVRDTTTAGQMVPPRVFYPPPSEEQPLVADRLRGVSDRAIETRGEEQGCLFRRVSGDEFPVSGIRTDSSKVNTGNGHETNSPQVTTREHDAVSSGQLDESVNFPIAENQTISSEVKGKDVEKVQHDLQEPNEDTRNEEKNTIGDKGKGKEVEKERKSEESAAIPEELGNESIVMELTPPILSALPSQRGRGKRAAALPRVIPRRTASTRPSTVKKSTTIVHPQAKEETKERVTRPARVQKTNEKSIKPPVPPQREPTAGPSRIPANTPAAPPRTGRSTVKKPPTLVASQPVLPTTTRGTKRGRGQVEPAAPITIREEERPARRLRSRKQEGDE
ncbi:hypothetical protein BDN72DRAFT_881064 [Pluteus cervinus]|uniref:Uncharacterized protein n=1 Tax=Pluteus cervinus TaxID=181527 RepID=A0ACD3AH33_9AGAR|nr:hypothetical protein BDN72DRAFT_881064 [Pluteus cervinus]